jgi:nicotinamide-nucleotide amidase
MTENKTISATIITIGDELLIGQTIDTNSSWMATELNKIGIRVKRRVAVGDVWEEIWQALEDEAKQSPIVLITGGLGPTSDDITKPLLCKFFDGKMVVDQGALENVRNIFENILKRPLLERNLKQAEVPDTCEVILNKRGTAPGMWFEKNNTIFVSMPGVPHEMKGMMEMQVLPALQERFQLSPFIHKTLLTAGIGESFLADILIDFEKNLPPEIKLAYLPNYGMVRLRLTADSMKITMQEIEEWFQLLKKLVAEYMVVDQDLSLQETISKIFIQQKQTLSLAESCTGGYISHLITAIPGSSQFYLGGVVSYDNELKINLLGVLPETIMQHGAVSLATVEQMAEGIRKKTGTDFALATSGIMGPGGATEDKHVGFVCVAVSSKEGTKSTTFNFRFDRQRNIELTAAHALNFLRKTMG